MFEKKHCSPRKDKIDSSCLSKKLLLKIATLLNQKYHTTIKLKKRSKKKLYEDISNALQKSDCQTESCWLQISKITNGLSNQEKKEMEESFKPFQPKEWNQNPNTWLTTTDIDNVMEQYEDKYPHFKYYGATPIDFNLKIGNTCMVSNLCNINLKDLKDKKCIGMVFNTDPHNKSGQHWFSMYVDLVGMNTPKPTIYYFDSATPVQTVEELPVQILQLIKSLQEQSLSLIHI